MVKISDEQLLAWTREKREKRIARLELVICKYLPVTIPKKEAVARSTAEYTEDNRECLFIHFKGFKEMRKMAAMSIVKDIEAFNRLCSTFAGMDRYYQEALEACNVPPSHVNDAIDVFVYMKQKCLDAVAKLNEIEADEPAPELGRNKACNSIFSLMMNEYLKQYQLPRKRRASIIAAIILTLKKQDTTKLKHQKLVKSIVQCIRNDEI